jgi:hypothetical protein
VEIHLEFTLEELGSNPAGKGYQQAVIQAKDGPICSMFQLSKGKN